MSENAQLRQTATKALWDLWCSLAGEKAESRIRTGTMQMDRRQYELAQQEFDNLVMDYPKYAEAHNKLATVLYMQRKYVQSIRECQITLEMNPNHFGAWNGLGLCHYELAHYQKAIESFNTAWTLQPYADFNKVYIAKCRGQLN